MKTTTKRLFAVLLAAMIAGAMAPGMVIAQAAQAVTYTITYNANGGIDAPDPQTKTQDVPLTLSTETPTREGYTFDRWAFQFLTTQYYQPGGTFTLNVNATLVAQYLTWT